jgi:hypothetical protein
MLFSCILPFGTLPAVSLLYMRATMHYYRVSKKKVMPFVIQICRELLVVEI